MADGGARLGASLAVYEAPESLIWRYRVDEWSLARSWRVAQQTGERLGVVLSRGYRRAVADSRSKGIIRN